MVGDFARFYSRESARYDESRYATRYGRLFRRLHHGVLTRELSSLPRQARILEVACGTGHATRLLVELGFSPVSVDLTPAMMERAIDATREFAMPPAFVRANARSLPFPDESFDAVISTRFLHLFGHDDQRLLLLEMRRLLRPQGLLIVDFDNWTSRWLLAVPYLIYNLLRYRRFAPFSIYNRIGPTRQMIVKAGFGPVAVRGVGGTHLVLAARMSQRLALWLGKLHEGPALRWLAEQFVVATRKR